MAVIAKIKSLFVPAPSTTPGKVNDGGASAAIRDKNHELMYRPNLSGWTPDRVLAAISQAESGSLQQASDLADAMLTDARISGILDTRTHGLLGLPISFVGGAPQAISDLEGTPGEPGEWWKMFDEPELSKLLTNGLMLGVGLAQLVPLPKVLGQPSRFRMETWSSRWLSHNQHNSGRPSEWEVQTEEGIIPIVPGDGRWILFTPYGSRRPWASALYTKLAIPWLLKRFSLEDRANHSETLGSPIWVGTASQGSTEKQRSKFLSQLRSLGKSGKVVLPNGWDFNLRESTSKSWEIYTEQVKWANEEFAIGIAGQLVTTEGTSGFSNGSIFENIKGDYIRLDGQRLSGCIREQGLEHWARLNYGQRKDAPWPQWATEKPLDLAVAADSIGKLGQSIKAMDEALAPHGMKVDAKKLVDQHGIPVIVQPIATPAPAAGGSNAVP